jgi:hypothetical protein
MKVASDWISDSLNNEQQKAIGDEFSQRDLHYGTYYWLRGDVIGKFFQS